MKIVSFKTYQAVSFMGRNETWFDVEKHNRQKAAIGGQGSGYTVKETTHGLLIQSKDEAVLTTWNNLAFVNYDLSSKEDSKTELKAESNVKKQKD